MIRDFLTLIMLSARFMDAQNLFNSVALPMNSGVTAKGIEEFPARILVNIAIFTSSFGQYGSWKKHCESWERTCRIHNRLHADLGSTSEAKVPDGQ